MDNLREKIAENYLSTLSKHINEFELGLARVAFLAGWDLALATQTKGEENDSAN
jgi:hypothetical protein